MNRPIQSMSILFMLLAVVVSHVTLIVRVRHLEWRQPLTTTESKMSEPCRSETYLGDGLYARFDGYHWWLRVPGLGGDHHVALDPEVLGAFLELVRHVEEQATGVDLSGAEKTQEKQNERNEN